MQTRTTPSLARAVLEGLSAEAKSLPAFMLYDARGSALFEKITSLPEYYLTRAERSILAEQGAAIADLALTLSKRRLDVLELGAGTAQKSQLLLRALAARQGHTTYVPADLSREPLMHAEARLLCEEPLLSVRPLLATHEHALHAARKIEGALFVWFLGSSIGNYEDREATLLLEAVRAALGNDGLFLLGADLKKDPRKLLPAYDDAQGVTAAFNKNVLVRINRELGGHFDLDAFRHRAIWNEGASRMEMHLESRRAQEIAIDGLGMRVALRAGECIHTESSHKYDPERLSSLLKGAGLELEHSFLDSNGVFGVHLVRPVRTAQRSSARDG